MHTTLLLILAATFAVFLLLTPTTADAGADDADREAATPKPTLFIIGDSTVKIGGRDNPQRGWGEELWRHFDLERINIENHAIGGRSSRTFRTEGRWQAVLDAAKPGDFVLMQFGHNDPIAPDDPKRPRGTIRGLGDETVDIIHPHTNEPETVHTFGWYMRQYVREAREKGMTPVVLSYIPRAPRPGETANPELSSYGWYAQQIAEQEDAAFIDLYGRIARAYLQMPDGEPKAKYFTEGGDFTHTNHEGAKMNARLVAEGIADLDGDAAQLADYLAAEPAVSDAE